MNDTTTPPLSQVPASPAPSASPAPAPSSTGQQGEGAPPSMAQESNWYGQTDVQPGETSGQFSPGNGQPGEPGQPGQPERMLGDHGEPPSQLHQALPPRQYDAFNVRDGYQVDPKEIQGYTQDLDLLRDDNQRQAAGQRLLDKHFDGIQKAVERTVAYQREYWNRFNEQQISELKSHPQLGGQNLPITLGNARYVLDHFVGRAGAEKLLARLDNGGLSNNVDFLTFLQKVHERIAPPEPIHGNPPAASQIMARNGGRDWYGQVDNPQQNKGR